MGEWTTWEGGAIIIDDIVFTALKANIREIVEFKYKFED
jgi:hypothetical protein